MQREMHRTSGWESPGNTVPASGKDHFACTAWWRRKGENYGGEQAKHLGDKQHQTHQDTCRATDSATPIL